QRGAERLRDRAHALPRRDDVEGSVSIVPPGAVGHESPSGSNHNEVLHGSPAVARQPSSELLDPPSPAQVAAGARPPPVAGSPPPLASSPLSREGPPHHAERRHSHPERLAPGRAEPLRARHPPLRARRRV